jgi:hypothetical protein
MSTLRTNTLQDAAGNNSVPLATVAAGTAKAWVNFNGAGTVAIRAQFNVSSITDNGAGNYTVNFTNAMPDANYCVTSSGATATSFSTNPGPVEATVGAYSLSTTSCTIASVRPGDGGEVAAVYDVINCFVAIFR